LPRINKRTGELSEAVAAKTQTVVTDRIPSELYVNNERNPENPETPMTNTNETKTTNKKQQQTPLCKPNFHRQSFRRLSGTYVALPNAELIFVLLDPQSIELKTKTNKNTIIWI
jgi:hypothetical protein